MIRSVAVAAVFACAISAGPAIANEPMAKVRGRIDYGDLELSNPYHLAKLHARVEQKARELCTEGLDKDWHDHPEIRACQARIVASAQPKVAKLAASRRPPSRLANHN
jgi:UrcA family protein